MCWFCQNDLNEIVIEEKFIGDLRLTKITKEGINDRYCLDTGENPVVIFPKESICVDPFFENPSEELEDDPRWPEWEKFSHCTNLIESEILQDLDNLYFSYEIIRDAMVVGYNPKIHGYAFSPLATPYNFKTCS
jgi:hypothetical protein